MKKTFVAGLLASLAAAGVASAQEAPRSARIAIIDMARVSAESLLGKGYAAQLEKLQTDLAAEQNRKQSDLAKLDAALKTLQDELEKQGAVLSEEARERKQVEIVRKGRERQAFLEDGQADLRRMQERLQQQAQSINNEFQLKIRPLVEQVAKEKGYYLVLDSQVAYTINREFDLTRDVIVKSDEAEKAKPAAAAAPPAAPATPPAPNP
jgi:outer membrane protein